MNLISIGLSGLNASNAGLTIAAHNVANVNTAGYSLQRVGFGSQVSLTAGSGVMISSVERVADNYLNQQLYKQTSSWGYNAVNFQYMERAESLLNDDSSSISKGLDGFYAALGEASTAPQDIAHRQMVISQTEAMVQRFNNLDNQLKLQSEQANSQLSAAMTDANTLLASLASLNENIKAGVGSGKDVSSLLDSRDETIREISELVDVNATYHDDGTVSLTLDRGQTLVNGSLASQFKMDAAGDVSLSRGNATLAVDDDLGGQIGGLIHYKTGELKELQQELDIMAYSFATQFNQAHQQGYDLNGDAGQAMFGGVDSIEGAAGKISMLITDPKQLAFSASADEPGNNQNLEKLNDLRNEAINIDISSLTAAEQERYQSQVAQLNGKSIYDNYTSLIGDWAIETAQYEVDTGAAQALVNQAQGDRDAVSGVNLDEEAANIMQYTQMYQANAQVISTAQQLFDVTMSMFR